MRSEAKCESKDLTSERKSRSGEYKKADAKDAASRDQDEEPNALIQSVVTFFFEDDAFAQTFETFAQKHCMVFDLDQDEMKLE